MIHRLRAPGLPPPTSPYSQVVVDGSYAFVAGAVAADVPDGRAAVGDVRAELEAVLMAIRGVLGRLGLGMDRVVRVDVHMTDLDEIGAMDEVYRRFFPEGALPARTCVEVRKLVHGCRVEITCVAELPGRTP
jgi:2-iminobutanoate/2-iminopropanoate deaminase